MAGPGEGKEFMRSIAEQKLKSFSIGAMGKRGVTRKEQEEMRKRMDEAEVGKVYEEFVSTFEDSPSSKVNKTWVKAGTFNAGNRKEDKSEHGKLYKPQSRLATAASSSGIKKEPKPSSASESKRPEKPGKKKATEKKKSNLEIFKEELKAIQEEREERHRIKGMIKGGSGGSSGFGSGSVLGGPCGGTAGMGAKEQAFLGDIGDKLGSHDCGDPNTTNLYLGNLSPNLTEKTLSELFGKYGPLASIKIMWPRTEDEKARGRNCGFVAYMSRRDGERALEHLLGKDVDGFEMKMGWGKPVPIPLHPIYVPPPMLKLTQPPPQTGLPFNTQPNDSDAKKWNLDKGMIVPRPNPTNEQAVDKFNRLLYRSKVKVMIPTDRAQLCLINRLVEFVIREGPMFEAMIMNRELNNPSFAFLFENQSPDHIYYRWRLYSMLQGDTKDDWSPDEFRMFKGGSVWVPPVKNLFTAGMPDDVFEESLREASEDRPSSRSSDKQRDRDRDRDRDRRSDSDRRSSRSSSRRDDDKDSKNKSGKSKKKDNGLSDSQRDRFEDMLRNLYPDRNPIAETMVWCIEHAEAGEEIVDCIAESLSILQTPLAKKLARLFLISDILHNCSVKGVPNVSYYRKGFQTKLPEIFRDLHNCYGNIDSRIKAEAFKQRVLNCFRAWEDWALYPQDFLIKLQNIFLGLVSSVDSPKGNGGQDGNADNDDVDGKELSDEDDVDGLPLDGAALMAAAQQKNQSKPQARRGSASDDSDVDGTPLEYGGGGSGSRKPAQKKPAKASLPAGFVPSKWETVDQETVQAQAVTSKWDIFDQEEDAADNKNVEEDDDDDVDGVPMGQDDEEQMSEKLAELRRQRLRDVEMKVMHYQDELESGQISSHPGWTISEQVKTKIPISLRFFLIFWFDFRSSNIERS